WRSRVAVYQFAERRSLHECQDRWQQRRGTGRSVIPLDRLMSAVSGKQIDAIIERHAALQARMATGDMAPADFVAASKEFAELEPVAKAAAEVTRPRAELVTLTATHADPEMKAMAEEEIAAVEAALPTAEHDLAIKLLPKDVADERAAMLEIRAGTGGDEAALFAGDLLRMYSRYADAQGWKVEIISANEA